MIVASYGAGTNSTAEIIEMYNRGIRTVLIIFSDTGNERPETYEYIKIFNIWLIAHDMPEITVVKKTDKYGEIMTLERNCIEKKRLPALAYGFKTCSLKFKIAPQEKFCNHFQPALEVWKRGEKVIKAIGYDAGEERRAKNYEDEKFKNWYPLIEWEIDREGCKRIIEEAGLPQPGKSSCFFCPSMKKREIFDLRDNHPDLLKRALTMEENAILTTVKGLGRSYSWKSLIEADENQLKMFVDVCDITCGCFDGYGE